MWYRDRVWVHYINDTLAADMASAVFLVGFIRQISITKEHMSSLEVFDLQRYKVIRKPAKIKNAIQERIKVPFIFVTCKN